MNPMNPFMRDSYGEEEEHLHPDLKFSKEERIRMALQAMKGALLIGVIYLAVFAAVIALLIWVWK